MYEKSKAIVLSSIKYGETSLICQVFTESFGSKSFLVKGAFGKKKKAALFSPLSILDIVFKNDEKKSLLYFKNFQTCYHYKDIFRNQTKIIISLFLAEFSHIVLKQEAENPELFKFLEKSFMAFDKKPYDFADFHLYILSRLTYFLGIQPNFEQENKPYFDSKKSEYSHHLSENCVENAALFRKCFELTFDSNTKNSFSQMERKILLGELLSYYSLHLENYREPKSVEVIKQLF